ncbi:hypothetical protein LOZ53_000300 [Ophidiomyces ophidiicola]|uniref:Uncharacterized protein n=1 Tax=Ophidiomyces ophidiicola TaxID=1387563 RepID=A0ACB8UWP9_9EURO|nr:uncharacterized protein LOZ57_002840 [Ophidiomyces ophidiicola]KAI1914363.1 hypothetical protein LOZ61_002265 [Ophidiomyces ophidiicola]KAI1927004.1 hypothetical protein LOZ64_000137 [Ophidiomyces ophidiicola]KAI1929175.1 hypothetical protein LOZ60_001826 [Ophidiomyces ophidiicola]KAI1948486.1 hypothetical protein LOZ57_002840 [Ophidiomyces ophidiicola]KAI1953132.1 hypothetical protein LOZ62_001195 [Ophidiomyces ophidiicola]
MSEHLPGHGGRSAPGPFGFLYTPYEHAPAPPPGPALLDDSESNMLDNFFTSMNANHLDNNDFWFGLNDHHGNAGFHFDWPELPPTFEGSTTSLPSHSVVPQRTHREPTIAVKQDVQVPSSDVLAAASMLYQNGVHGNDYSSTFTSQIFTENGLEDISSHHTGVKHARFGDDGRRSRFSFSRRRETYPEKGVHSGATVTNTSHSIAKDNVFGTLRWGSDVGFAEQGYRVPPDQPTMEERTAQVLHSLECFESQSSAPNTRPSSPARRRAECKTSEWGGMLQSPTSLKQFSPTDQMHMDDDLRPTKRRKNMKGKPKDEEETYSPPLGRPSHPRRDRRWSSNSSTQPRRAKVHVIKPPRENLTEEQKRANHILSEQKRRNLIKQGFDELCSLVPELRGGGFSKSTMLGQAAGWLEDLLEGNEILKRQLEDLKKQTGG